MGHSGLSYGLTDHKILLERRGSVKGYTVRNDNDRPYQDDEFGFQLQMIAQANLNINILAIENLLCKVIEREDRK